MVTGIEPVDVINALMQKEDSVMQCLHSEESIDVNCIQWQNISVSIT